ncbi:MAG: Fe-S protein assembly co-chaperone HscB [Nitrospirae bacterium]|nr:Fe-S protein assembly co-chaperone HscB [Nitrospirota bacterium]
MTMDGTQKTPTKRSELQMARSMCWHCQSEVTGEYFCEQCVKVQPLSKEMDYFTCLGLPRLLTIDLGALEAKFYELSRTFHPDFYQRKTDSEQNISLGNSAMLNTAYRTLKDPIQRAEYLLRLEAGSAKDIRTSPPADLFEEILTLQEDLEAYRSASDQDPATVARLRDKLATDRELLEQRQREMDRRLFELFTRWDALHSRQSRTDPASPDFQKDATAVLKEMREILSNRTYLCNIVNDLTATTA